MLLKSADDKEQQITILNNLLNHPKIPSDKKNLIERELRNLKTGIATEKEAAYEIDFYFGQSENRIVLHDLRFEINGRVAQIDHLVMNRLFDVYVLETKTFSSGLSINEMGEFSTYLDGRKIGIPSPIQQNERHITVLRDVFNSIDLPTRLGITIQPSFHSVVLVSPKAVINRPKSGKVDLNNILKLDQFHSWYKQKLESGPEKASDLAGIFKLSSKDTIKEIGEKLIGFHRPVRIDYIQKFDLTKNLLSPDVSPAESRQHKESRSSAKKNDSNYCYDCKETVHKTVADFCWKDQNKKRFGGRVYCRSCQGKY